MKKLMLALALFMIYPFAGASALEEVRFGAYKVNVPLLHYSLPRLSESMGHMREEGLRATFHATGNTLATERDALLVRREINFAFNLFVAKGEWRNKTEVLLEYFSHTFYSLVARRDIKSVVDLGGKRIVTHGCGGSEGPGLASTQLKRFVANHRDERVRRLRFHCGAPEGKADQNTIYLIPVQVQQRRAMMENGTADASHDLPIVLWPLIQSKRFHIILSSRELNSSASGAPPSLLFTQRGFAAKRPEFVARVVKALQKTMRTIKENPVLAKRHIAAYIFPNKMRGDTSEKRYRMLSLDERAAVDFRYEELRGAIPENLCGNRARIAAGIRLYTVNPKLHIAPEVFNLRCQ